MSKFQVGDTVIVASEKRDYYNMIAKIVGVAVDCIGNLVEYYIEFLPYRNVHKIMGDEGVFTMYAYKEEELKKITEKEIENLWLFNI